MDWLNNEIWFLAALCGYCDPNLKPQNSEEQRYTIPPTIFYYSIRKL